MPRAYHTPQKATDPAEKACPERYAAGLRKAFWNKSRRILVKFGPIRRRNPAELGFAGAAGKGIGAVLESNEFVLRFL
jgi:hypothetical protein